MSLLKYGIVLRVPLVVASTMTKNIHRKSNGWLVFTFFKSAEGPTYGVENLALVSLLFTHPLTLVGSIILVFAREVENHVTGLD